MWCRDGLCKGRIMSLFGHRVLNGGEKRSWWENEVGKAEIVYIYTRIGIVAVN